MAEWIQCIDAMIYKKDDGTMDCPWLTPFYGDMTQDEYEAAGTALSVRRGCEYCYMMLEWKTRMKEEGWTEGKFVAHASHLDWPGELSCVNEILDSCRGLIGYEVQWKLYKSLHEVEAAGWELIYFYFSEGKEIYKQEEVENMKDCGLPKGCEEQCCLNRSGMCTLDTADFYDIDRAVGMRGCGFIGVNDRYLIWKYGVPYKEFTCGNCQYFEGETHGVCTNTEVKPHTKGITVVGIKTYIESKEYYSGAGACKEFKKQEGERLAKRKYWTKCGRKFEKSSTASVTGYEIDLEDKQCTECPFQVDVKEGWPPVHKRWECRAGSHEPNQKDDWRGSIEDKNTLKILSLHNDFLESVLDYCKAQPDLSASYNQDEDDCRRSISVSCSQNKKGIAAKQKLVEKFFPVAADPEGIGDSKKACCESCVYGIDFGESVEYIKCQEGKHNKDVRKNQPACANYIPCDNELDDEPEGDLEEQLEELLREGDEEVYLDKDKKCKSNNESCGYYCDHNEGCALLIVTGKALNTTLDIGKVDCDVYREKAGIVNDIPETVNETTEIVIEEPENVTEFDYSTVDQDTASFLQEKSSNIVRYKMASMLGIARELKEAQDKLANHNQGTFIAWCQSIGYSKSTIYDYLRGLDWVVRNSDNGIDFENLQPSLLLEVSKKSTPAELEEKVLSGEITSRKELEAERQRIRTEVESEYLKKLDNEKQERIKAQDRAEKIFADNRAAETEKFELRQAKLKTEDKLKQQDIELRNVRQQLEKAKHNGDPSEIKRLGGLISEYQQEITSLKQQLKAKPIEVPAVKEVIPESIRVVIYEKVARLYEGLLKLTEAEINIFAEDVIPDYSEDVRNDLRQASQVLKRLDNTILEVNCDD